MFLITATKRKTACKYTYNAPLSRGAIRLKPPKFSYHAPLLLDEVVQLLVRYQGNARLLAGGQSLVPMLNFRLLSPQALIDLRGA